MATGKVKFFNDEKGFGFIERENDTDVFVHISELEDGSKPKQGDSVEFELGEGRKGPCAKGVKVSN